MPFMASRSLIIRINTKKGYPNAGMAGKIRHSLNVLRNFGGKTAWDVVEGDRGKKARKPCLEGNQASSLRRANCSK